jgi:hypothetical protein
MAEELLKMFLSLPGLSRTSSYVSYIKAIRAIGAFYGPPNRFKSLKDLYIGLYLKEI